MERMNGMAQSGKYPVEMKERAVAMVRELERELGGSGRGAITRTAKHLGLNAETVRNWVRDDDRGQRPSGERLAGSDADKDARIRELEQRLREAERANEILKAASAFFAQEMSPRPPR
ncbi:transposase [Haloechinothrix alba]|uniref:Transposase n=1 Tax=Haloechinothrix alba TaxID=664784 RepID=A0A239A874_9PSEU|nr:transposase [Haloechinothrix alba]